MVSAERSNPYYVYLPSVRGRSAGVRVLIELVALLNDSGCEAYIASPASDRNALVYKDRTIPVLRATDILRHRAAGAAPIAVYPEIVHGNPLRAPVVVRYVLNVPGILGGDASYDPREHVYCYTRTLSAGIAGSHLLNIQVVDQEIFRKSEILERSGSCFYAGKYRSLGGNPVGLPSDAIEILRDGHGAQSPQEIAEIFRKSEIFYVFEDTLMVLEAALCGCPSVYIRNSIFPAAFGDKEFGISSVYMDGSDYDRDNAERNVRLMVERFAHLKHETYEQVCSFVSRTQCDAAGVQSQAETLFVAKSDGVVRAKTIWNGTIDILKSSNLHSACKILFNEYRLLKINFRLEIKKKFSIKLKIAYKK